MNANATDKKDFAALERDALARVIVDNSLDAIITFAGDGKIVSFNPAAERLFGFAAAEAIGNPIERLLTSQREKRFIIRGIELKQGAAELKSLRPFGPTLSDVSTIDGKDGRPPDLVDGVPEVNDLGAGKVPKSPNRRLQCVGF